MKQIKILVVLLLATGVVVGCSCGSSTPKYEKTPVDIILRDNHNVQPLSIILHDMDASEGFPEKYKHKYKIIKDVDNTVKEEITGWMEVSERFFARHQNNMGMTIASKDTNGKVSKVAAPPGYANYVGNQKYGQWKQQSDGTSFWAFYGQYAFLSSMFGFGPSSHVYHHHYNTFRSDYSSGRAYYGPRSSTGSYRYGTSGTATARNYSSSTWSQKPSSFKQSVRSKVTRSASTSSGSRTSTRSGSRYSSGSSSRSRGGGFGK